MPADQRTEAVDRVADQLVEWGPDILHAAWRDDLIAILTTLEASDADTVRVARNALQKAAADDAPYMSIANSQRWAEGYNAAIQTMLTAAPQPQTVSEERAIWRGVFYEESVAAQTLHPLAQAITVETFVKLVRRFATDTQQAGGGEL